MPQRPMDGVSMVYTFDDAAAPDRHTVQYFEMFGNRAMYQDGWFARTIHRAPWEMQPRRALADDIWELYDTRNDFSLVNDLSAQHPEKLAELKALFMAEAEKNHALPIDDRVIERVNAALVGRPDLMEGRTSLTLAEGMTGMSENVFLNIKNKSKTITAEIEVPAGGGNGAIMVQGGRFGGWALYVKDGVPAYDYNFLGLKRYTVAAKEKLEAGQGDPALRVRLRRRRDRQGRHRHPVRERPQGRRGAHRPDPAHDLLRGRDRGRRHRPGDAGGRDHRFGGPFPVHREHPQGHRRRALTRVG